MIYMRNIIIHLYKLYAGFIPVLRSIGLRVRHFMRGEQSVEYRA